LFWSWLRSSITQPDSSSRSVLAEAVAAGRAALADGSLDAGDALWSLRAGRPECAALDLTGAEVTCARAAVLHIAARERAVPHPPAADRRHRGMLAIAFTSGA
jgi:hypothetical protein